MAEEWTEILDLLCPMHARLDAAGTIRHAGPTLRKLSGEAAEGGARFLEIFELTRPRGIESMTDLAGCGGTRLQLRLRSGPRTRLKGMLAPLPDGGAVVNLSFGISILDAVRDYALTNADFAATDLAMEMLYLVEAKSAAMEASRMLNLRLRGAMIAAEEQAYTDTLTGLKNRRALDHVLARLIGRGEDFALMQLDLDRFKAVNDTMGHAAGDHVLQHVARILVEETRERDTVARIGGDEFVLLLLRPGARTQIAALAARLIARIEAPIVLGEDRAAISASAGTALSRDYKAPEAERLLADADAALYAAKRAGRAGHAFGACRSGAAGEDRRAERDPPHPR